MWGLIYKNFLVWHPARSGNVYILAAALGLSILDLLGVVPVLVWPLLLLFLIILGQGAGVGVFSADSRNDSTRFLDWLPVPRWKRWVANWLNEALVLALAIVILTWHRTLAWVPPSAERPQEFAMHQVLFASRFTFLLGGGGLVFFSFGHSLFWRTFFRFDGWAQIPGMMGTGFFFGVPLLVLSLLSLAPTLDDMCLSLWAMGLLFSLCALASHLVPPAGWHFFISFLVVGIPCLFLLTVAQVGLFAWHIPAWEGLKPAEPVDVHDVQLVQNPRPTLLLRVRSLGSGFHAVSIDLQDATVRDLGRFLDLAGNSDEADRLLYWSGVGDSGFRVNRSKPLILVDALTGAKTSTPLTRQLTTADGRKYEVYEYLWLPNGRGAVTYGHPIGEKDSGGGLFFIFDSQFRLRRTVPACSSFYRISGNYLLVHTSAEKSESVFTRHELLPTGEAPVPVAGALIGAAPDLSAVVTAQWVVRENMYHPSVHLLNLGTGQVTPLIGEGELPPYPAANDSRSSRDPWMNVLDSHISTRHRSDNIDIRLATPTLIDWRSRRIFWVSRRTDEETARHRLLSTSLDGGAPRVLLTEEQLPTVPAFARNVTGLDISIDGLSADEKKLRYSLAREIWEVPVKGGNPSPIRSHPGTEYTFRRARDTSPDGQLFLHVRRVEQPGPPSWELCVYPSEYTDTLPPALYTLSSYPSFVWLNNQEFVVACGGQVWISDLAGRNLRTLLDHPSGPSR